MQWSQQIYLKTFLRDQELSLAYINVVFQVLCDSRLTYAAQAWQGFLSSKQVGKPNGFVKGLSIWWNDQVICYISWTFKQMWWSVI